MTTTEDMTVWHFAEPQYNPQDPESYLVQLDVGRDGLVYAVDNNGGLHRREGIESSDAEWTVQEIAGNLWVDV
jgi:hypothetical protein